MKQATTQNRFSSLTMLSGSVGLALIVALLVLSLVNEYRNANRHARVEVENISRVLEEHALATVNKADVLLREVQRNVRPGDMRVAGGVSAVRMRELHDLMKSQREDAPEIAVIHVTDAMGNHIYSSLDKVPRINIADRYHFTRHREDAVAGLVISPPLISRTTGKWTLVLTRRLDFEDGSFAGIVNVILNLEYFQQFYRTLDLGAHGLVALDDKELRVAARYPPSEKDMGKSVPNHPARPAIEQGKKLGIYIAVSPLDGVKHMVSFRQVRDLPLIVLAGIAEDDYLADWRRHIVQYGAGVLIFGLVMIAFSLRQRRAENQLHAASIYARSLIEASLDPLVTISADGKIMDVNSATEIVTGRPRDKLIGSDFSDYFTEPEKARTGYQEVFSQGQVTDYPLAIRHVSGKVTEVLYNATVYRNELGAVAGVFAAARDVSDLKRAESQLRAASHYSRSLIEASLDPLVTISADGKITDVNKATEQVTGVARGGLIGSDFADYFTDPEKARAGYRQVFSEGFVTDYPLAIRHVSGKITEVLYNASVYRDTQGDVAGVFAAARDVTELKRADEEIRQLNETLERRVQEEVAKNREKDHILIQQSRLAAMGEMVHNIAHQWRQPLNALSIILANIKDDYEYGELTPASLDQTIANARRLLQRMSTTVDDFRDFFRPDRESGEFDMSQSVEDALFVMDASLKNNSIEVERDMPKGLMAYGYSNQFAQVVLNILANAKEAIQHHAVPQGWIRIVLGQTGGRGVLTIADNGGGIADDVLPKIFDPYFTTKDQGSGIGLYMSKMIIERNLNGTIEATNTEHGALVTITLPLLHQEGGTS